MRRRSAKEWSATNTGCSPNWVSGSIWPVAPRPAAPRTWPSSAPNRGQAVSRGAGLPYAARLLPLPAFLVGAAPADAAAIADGLRLTGYFLERDVISGRNPAILAVRQRFAERIALVAGTPTPAGA